MTMQAQARVKASSPAKGRGSETTIGLLQPRDRPPAVNDTHERDLNHADPAVEAGASPASGFSFSRVSVLGVQRKCACGGEAGPSGECAECGRKRALGLQTKLTVGAADDRYEREADHVASEVVRMPARETQHQPAEITPLVQRQSHDRGTGLPAGASRSIQDQGGGTPLPDTVRRFMEPRFGADFSDVRLHSSPESSQLNESLHSRAFTYGRDIWLGAGESASDLPLLAHELTHVLQQSPSLRRSPRRPLASEPVIQRKNDYFTLPNDFRRKGAGTRTHDFLLPEIAKENPGLFFEVNIPGGKKDVTAAFTSDEPAVVGRADFYYAKPSTTIGVKFVGDDPEPEYLGSHRDLRTGVPTKGDPQKAELKKFDHAGKAAPVGKKNMIKKAEKASKERCRQLERPALCRLDEAPIDIRLGDLKPADEGERRLGARQLDNYITGINLTASKVRDFAKDNPTKIDPIDQSWNPSPTRMSGGAITIPDQYKPFNTNKRRLGVIRYEDGKPEYKAKAEPADVYVVPDPDHTGLLIYEYVPVNRPKDVSFLERAQEVAARRLENPVISELKGKPEVVQAKRKPGPPPPPPSGQFRIQRKKVNDKFKLEEWKPTFERWRDKEAKDYLGSGEMKKTEYLETLLEIKKRSLPNLDVPTGSQKVAAGMRKIEHWSEHGGTYGRLRGLFGGVYVKFVDFYEKTRDRFRRLLPKTPGTTSGFLGTLVKIGMKMLRFIAHLIMGEVAERLTTAFRQAAENLIERLFGKEVTELEKHLAEVRAYLTEFEELAKKDIQAEINKVIEPYEKHINQIQSAVDKVVKAMGWVNRIKWLARAAACIAVPGIGCILGLIGTHLLERIASEIAERCWFRRDVMFDVLKKIDFIKQLPGKIADLISAFLIGLLPGKAKELIGDINRKEADLKEEHACEDLPDESPPPEPEYVKTDWKPTPVDLAVGRLYEKYGDKPGNPIGAVGDLLNKSGLSSMPATVEGVERVRVFLERVNGDAAAIRTYTRMISRRGRLGRLPKLTLEQALSMAETQIARGVTAEESIRLEMPEREPAPQGPEQTGGITIFKF